MDAKQLAEIKARAEAATPGPWEFEWSMDREGDEELWLNTSEQGNGIYNRRNLDFAAHARQDVPNLVAEVERLRAALSAAYTIATRGLAEPDAGTAELVNIATALERELAPNGETGAHDD